MPVFNGAAYLGKAIDSILAQDFKDFEFVIVDDGSTDASPEVLKKYAAEDARIRIISRPNTGIVGALNDGVNAARAPLVARMDADDVCIPSRLRKQVEHMERHPRCVAVGSRILLIDADGWPICEMCQERTHSEIDEVNLRAGGAAMNHPSVMFRREVVRAVGGYRQDLIYAEDLDLWLRLAEIGELYNIPEVLVHYRMHAHSISHARALEQRKKWCRAVADARIRRGAPSQTELLPRDTVSRAVKVSDHHIRWAWQALMAGNVGTARKHAFQGLRRKPFSVESWRLAACAARGH
jgi:glycosyltransferase involved in cell wall biosynthesis